MTIGKGDPGMDNALKGPRVDWGSLTKSKHYNGSS